MSLSTYDTRTCFELANVRKDSQTQRADCWLPERGVGGWMKKVKRLRSTNP